MAAMEVAGERTGLTPPRAATPPAATGPRRRAATTSRRARRSIAPGPAPRAPRHDRPTDPVAAEEPERPRRRPHVKPPGWPQNLPGRPSCWCLLPPRTSMPPSQVPAASRGPVPDSRPHRQRHRLLPAVQRSDGSVHHRDRDGRRQRRLPPAAAGRARLRRRGASHRHLPVVPRRAHVHRGRIRDRHGLALKLTPFPLLPLVLPLAGPRHECAPRSPEGVRWPIAPWTTVGVVPNRNRVT